jgi:hypothetical protein
MWPHLIAAARAGERVCVSHCARAEKRLVMLHNPPWAPRVRTEKIFQLYTTFSRGLLDDALIDEVGWALHARCVSINLATAAAGGLITCPSCKAPIAHPFARAHPSANDRIACPNCDWTTRWSEYKRGYQKKHLSAGGAAPFFSEFEATWPTIRDANAKMMAIDLLIHRYHSELSNTPTRPAAVCLIEANKADTIRFLDQLTQSPNLPPPMRANAETFARNTQLSRQLWDR